MAESKDDLARALEAMSSGQAHEHPAQPEPQDESAAPAPAVRHVHRSASPTAARPTAAADRPGAAEQRGLKLRQTMIPPLLTMGTLMPLMGLVSLLLGNESPLGEQKTVPMAMIVLGLLILGVATVNMLQVRHLLSASSKR